MGRQWIRDRHAARCPGCGLWILLNDYKDFENGPLFRYKLADYCKQCVITMRQMIASDVRASGLVRL